VARFGGNKECIRSFDGETATWKTEKEIRVKIKVNVKDILVGCEGGID